LLLVTSATEKPKSEGQFSATKRTKALIIHE
jgi:hypothetical protein